MPKRINSAYSAQTDKEFVGMMMSKSDFVGFDRNEEIRKAIAINPARALALTRQNFSWLKQIPTYLQS